MHFSWGDLLSEQLCLRYEVLFSVNIHIHFYPLSLGLAQILFWGLDGHWKHHFHGNRCPLPTVSFGNTSHTKDLYHIGRLTTPPHIYHLCQLCVWHGCLVFDFFLQLQGKSKMWSSPLITQSFRISVCGMESFLEEFSLWNINCHNCSVEITDSTWAVSVQCMRSSYNGVSGSSSSSNNFHFKKKSIWMRWNKREPILLNLYIKQTGALCKQTIYTKVCLLLKKMHFPPEDKKHNVLQLHGKGLGFGNSQLCSCSMAWCSQNIASHPCHMVE